MVKLCFSLSFIPLDPDPRTQMNADPTGSGSTSLYRDIDRIREIIIVSFYESYLVLSESDRHIFPDPTNIKENTAVP